MWWARGQRRVKSALPKPGEATLLNSIWSVGRKGGRGQASGLWPFCCDVSELQAQLGASLKRLVLTFCCQRQRHPKRVFAWRPGWSWQQGPEKEGACPKCAARASKSKHVKCRARGEIQEVQVKRAAFSPTPQEAREHAVVCRCSWSRPGPKGMGAAVP